MYVVRMPKNLEQKLSAFRELAKDDADYKERLSLAIAKEYKKQLLRHIENQDLGWTPLNEKYLASKIRKGLSQKTWKATGLLKESIEVIKTPEGYFVGITGEKKYENGTPVSLVAFVLEYGSSSRGIPARPLFRPTRRKILKNINMYVKTENDKHIKYLVNKFK